MSEVTKKVTSGKSHNKNPYRKGSDYHKMFAYWMSKRALTIQEMIKFAVENLGLTEAKAGFNTTVIFSARESSEIGDCRGNLSCHGEVAYAHKLNRATKMGVKESQRYQLRWRKVPLARRTRNEKIETKGEKVASIVNKAEVKIMTKEEGIKAFKVINNEVIAPIIAE